MASYLRRLATNSGEVYRSVFLPLPRPSSLRKLLTAATPDFLGTGALDAVPAASAETPGAETLDPFDLEASRARRAAYTEARRQKLEKIADEVMALNKIEYKDYSALLRHKLCRGEKSLFDVKLEKFEPESKLDVIRAILDFSDLDLQAINDFLEGAPSVVKKGVTKEEAEKIVEKLKEAGATAVLE